MENQLTQQTIETLEAIQGEFSDRLIPQGTSGIILEAYQDPECYAIDLAIPDTTLAGGFAYENVILFPNQFKIVSPQSNERTAISA
jgi:hypothetical protein